MKQRWLCGRRITPGPLLVLACCGTVLASGCEKKTESGYGSTKDGTHDDGRSLEPNVAGGSKAPEDWPTDVAIYPGSKVLMTKSNPTQQLLFLETADSEETALEFYKSKFAPMKPRATTNEKQQSVLSYQDGTGRRVMLSIGKQAGGGPKTLIALIVNRPQVRASNTQ